MIYSLNVYYIKYKKAILIKNKLVIHLSKYRICVVVPKFTFMMLILNYTV